MSIAQYIDHTILKPTTTREEVNQVCDEAIAFGFAAVCIPPVYVQQTQKKLAGTPVKVATVIGFPFGYEHIAAKVTEAEQAVKDGANELDMVMNMTAFKNSDFNTLKKEVTALLSVTEPHDIILKVIIESGILSEAEIIACCELYRKFNVAFLKTSTGYASKGATLEAVQIMRKHLPDNIRIKASGGIKTYAFAQQLIDAGATRLGCSAGVAIVQQQPADEQDY